MPHLLASLCVLSLLLSMLPASMAAAEQPQRRVHPLIQKLAAEHPDQQMRVIVIGHDSDQLGAQIDRKGGKNRKGLSLVKGMVTDVSAKAALELADDSSVSLVTIDPPMMATENVDVDGLAVDYPLVVRAPELWNSAQAITGAGITVAVLDTGMKKDRNDLKAESKDLNDLNDDLVPRNRVVGEAEFGDSATGRDAYGHGTHVAGIIAGSGRDSNGRYMGIAPQANLLNVKVSDDSGVTYVSDVIEALQWVIKNKEKHHIRIVNLSLISSMAEPYEYSPLDAAVEAAWLSGIVVVVSSGNMGPNSAYFAPANDPFVITVGAVDTNGTVDIGDDSIPEWSSYGATQSGFSKPEVVAPGRRIVSVLADLQCTMAQQYRDRIVERKYLRLSGTSMAAPMVSGVAALALQAHPNWTPDQFKNALMNTSRHLSSAGSGNGEIDAVATLSLQDPGYANAGIPFNAGIAAILGTTTYNSATWNSATWNSATWNSATWNSATWNSATWNSATWNSATWNSATWNSAYPD
jgi:serine protease AprX